MTPYEHAARTPTQRNKSLVQQRCSTDQEVCIAYLNPRVAATNGRQSASTVDNVQCDNREDRRRIADSFRAFILASDLPDLNVVE